MPSVDIMTQSIIVYISTGIYSLGGGGFPYFYFCVAKKVDS